MAIVDKEQQIRQVMILLIIILFIGGFYDIYLSKILEKNNLDMSLKKLAKSMDNKCPYYDDDLVLEKVSFIKGKTIRFEYKLMGYEKNDFDLPQLKKDLIESLIDEIGSIEELVVFRNNDVIFEYVYFDKQREEMFKIGLLFNTPITGIE